MMGVVILNIFIWFYMCTFSLYSSPKTEVVLVPDWCSRLDLMLQNEQKTEFIH